MKLKCVAILGQLFLKTNEVSLEIQDCQQRHVTIGSKTSQSTAIKENIHNKYDKFDKILVSNQRKSKIPFDFVKSRSVTFYINLLLFAVLRLLNAKYFAEII